MSKAKQAKKSPTTKAGLRKPYFLFHSVGVGFLASQSL
jgi:hypothetical protein